MNQQAPTTRRWQQVKQIFQAAIEVPRDERNDYLMTVCADDSSLRAEVESLIAAHEAPGSFLDIPAFDLADADSGTVEINPLVGKFLGRYQILALLGKGGVGEVYKAKDTTLGRDVAIKVLPSNFSIDQDRLHRFAQEARAASALNHPNIITIHEFGHEDGVPYIVSEFIEGQTLRRRMHGERLGVTEILEIAIQITSALNAAHEAGIVHRDIKLENIMVRPDGLVKVLDFGLAKLIEPRPVGPGANETEASTLDWGRTGAGVVMGTVNYMSPEQARGLAVDARTDIFSLGVVLYEMASGRSPFASATVADVIVSILEKEPPPLAQFTSGIPQTFEWIILKALRKDCSERYQSARELLNDLKSLKSGETTISLPLPKGKDLIAGIKQRWHTAAIGLAAVIAITAGVSYFSNSKKTIESIAVLPFTNIDGGSETEYLAEGITETLINDLSQLPSLKVKPRNTVFRYKKPDMDPLAVGRELEVEAVLTGQVAWRGDNLSISIQLIEVRENLHLWGAKYSGRSSDILVTQARIARDVTESLRLRVSPAEHIQTAKRYTNDAAAHQMYMKGRYFWNKRTSEGYREAIECFTSAIERDPAFALAYAGLADCYVLGGGFRLSGQETMIKAKSAAIEALKIDETLAEAHASLGQVKMFYDWNPAGAEASFKRAIELKPSYETAHHWYAIMLAALGRFEEAIDRIKRAQDINPVSISITKDAGMIYYYARQYDPAILQIRKSLNLSPDYYPVYSTLGDIYLQTGRKDEALAEFRKADALAGDRVLFTKAAIGYAYAVSNQKEKAMAVLNDLQKKSHGRPIPPFYLAMLYTGLGKKDAAFKWLDQAYQERAYRLVNLKVDPAFDSLRSDPRFDDLLRRLNLIR